jgi:uncharacterized protein YacL
MRVIFGFNIKDLIKNIFPMTMSAIIMGLCGWGLELISNRIIWQIFAVIICIIIYFTVLFVFFPKIRKEVFESKYFTKIKNKFKRKNSDKEGSEKVEETNKQ